MEGDKDWEGDATIKKGYKVHLGTVGDPMFELYVYYNFGNVDMCVVFSCAIS